MAWGGIIWHWTLAIAVRFVLVLLGAGDWLLWRPEVSTPANTALKTREGLWLLQYGLSPYQGASCHVPPLWLAVAAPWSQHRLLSALPNIVCDVVAAAAVFLAASGLFRQLQAAGHKRDEPWVSPEQLSLLYLFNPFTVLTCVAGTTTSVENMAVMLAVAGGVLHKAPLAGSGVALGAYVGLHPVLLAIPVMMLLRGGAEDILQQVPPWPLNHRQRMTQQQQQQMQLDGEDDGSSEGASHGVMNKAVAGKDQRVQQQQQAAVDAEPGSAPKQQHRTAECWAFVVSLLLCSTVLFLLSDSMLQQHPEAQCLPGAAKWLQGKVTGNHVQHIQRHSSSICWVARVHKFSLLLEDFTPTIGLWWYFFTEMFDAFRPFFLFVFHSFAVILAVPVALRFPNRPLFVAWVQLYITCMFKPYACVGDLVPWMTLLPLLQQQLQCIKMGLFFVNSFMLLVVLGPAMWHQWIVVDAANSNFFYSITLLLGVWYTVFLVQMLRFTVLLDRRLAGKDHLLPADVVAKNAGKVTDE